MGSSLGFGSSACDYGSCDPRPIQTRFRFGFGRQPLTSPHTANSPDHSSIGTPSRYRDESRQHASTACRHTVSVSISLPSRGAFHLSLTVLVHYRSLEVFSLRQWSDWFPTQETFRVVLEGSDRRLIAFAYRAITVYGGPFPAPSANDQFFGLRRGPPGPTSRLTTPLLQRLPPLTRQRVWLFPFRSPLLRG